MPLKIGEKSGKVGIYCLQTIREITTLKNINEILKEDNCILPPPPICRIKFHKKDVRIVALGIVEKQRNISLYKNVTLSREV